MCLVSKGKIWVECHAVSWEGFIDSVYWGSHVLQSHVCCSIAQSCPTLCSPMDWSMPGSPVLHYLPKFAQMHVHGIGWCHPTLSSSVIPFSCPQSFPASESFPTSGLFTSGGQSISVSASASVLPMNMQGCFPLGWTGLISLPSMGLSRVFSSTSPRHPCYIYKFIYENSVVCIVFSG